MRTLMKPGRRGRGEASTGRKLERNETLDKLDPDQLEFVEILAKLMVEHELFKEEYTQEDFDRVITWLQKLRAQIDITIDSLGGENPSGQ